MKSKTTTEVNCSHGELQAAIAEAERVDAARLDPEIQDIPRLFRTLLFDCLHADHDSQRREIEKLAILLSIEKPSPPPQWRLEAWESILGSRLFKAISRSKSRQSTFYDKGLRQGAWSCIARIYAKTLSSYPFSPASRDIADLYPLLIDHDSFEEALMSPHKKDALDYLKGLQKSIETFATDTGEAVRKNLNYNYLIIMIEHTEIVQKLDTVEELHRFLRAKLGHHFPNSIESFKVACNRLKFKGHNYRSRESS